MPQKILIVDDAADVVKILEFLLKKAGYEVFVAATGWELDDRMRVWATVDGGSEIDLLNTAGQDIDDLAMDSRNLAHVAEIRSVFCFHPFRVQQVPVSAGQADGIAPCLAYQHDDLFVDTPGQHHLDHVYRRIVRDA